VVSLVRTRALRRHAALVTKRSRIAT